MESANDRAIALGGSYIADHYYKRDFWLEEGGNYVAPHFRLEKVAGIVNYLAGEHPRDLLDVGCGPATLRLLLHDNIRYFGIDIAIREPAPYLRELDLLESPVSFDDATFDIVVAQGLFEYLGVHQSDTMREMRRILRRGGGLLVATYVNFGHIRRQIYEPYSNVQPLADFRSALEEHFWVRRSFATAHNWNHSEPNRPLMRRAQLPLTFDLPVISRRFAVEYVFICSPRLS